MKWARRFLNVAYVVAGWSKDTTKVGAVAVDDSRRIIETGYNGIARGVSETESWRFERPTKYHFMAHAEENLVAHAARDRLAGSTVYVTHPCCTVCARMLINAGVKKVVHAPNDYNSGTTEVIEWARQMFNEAGVEYSCEVE